MTALKRYHDDLASFRRVVHQAAPKKRAEVFFQICREGVRLASVGGVPKPDVMDALYAIGIEAGLDENVVQDTMARAVANPLVPATVRWEALPAIGVDISAKPIVSLVIHCMADVEPEPVQWLWPERIALGKLTVIAGEPGLGKSQLTCALAAAVSTGGTWPNSEGRAPKGSVVILSAEDAPGDTVRPRLDAAGADVEKVYTITAVTEGKKGNRSFNLQTDLAALEAIVKKIGDVRLIVIDPISSYLGKVDSHRNAELRAVLEPVGLLAARLGVAAIAITHLNKAGPGSASANSRVIGSIAFVAAARAAYIVCRDPEDHERRLFLPSKNNLGRDSGGLAFKIGEFSTPSGLIAPAVIWSAVPVSITADQALAPASQAPQRDQAEDFLRDLLATGPMKTKDVEAEAKAADISWTTIRRAKDKLKITVDKSKKMDGAWLWSLP